MALASNPSGWLSPLPVVRVRMKREAGQLAQPWWEPCQGYSCKLEEVLMHIAPPSPAEPRNQISAMTLVSTGIRRGNLPRVVLGCYEWTFMLEHYSSEAGEGLGYLQVNPSLWQTTSAVPQLCQVFSPAPGAFSASIPEAEVPFCFDGSWVLGPRPRWADTWCLSAGRREFKDICLQKSLEMLFQQQRLHQSDGAGLASGLRRCPGSSGQGIPVDTEQPCVSPHNSQLKNYELSSIY